MSFYPEKLALAVEVSALTKSMMKELLGMKVTLYKPTRAGCYLIVCHNSKQYSRAQLYLIVANYQQAKEHLDDGSTIWTPVRFCDVRK